MAKLLIPLDLRKPQPFARNPDNAEFPRWLVGCIFCKVADRNNAKMLHLLLRHPDINIRAAAGGRLAEILGPRDLEYVISQANSDDDSDGYVTLLAALDARFNPLPDGVASVYASFAPPPEEFDDDIPF